MAEEPIRVLVVDDEEMIRSLVCRSLKRTAMALFEFTEARNGQEALEKLNLEEHDLVLLDWNMPRMNGRDCAASIRAMPGGDDIAIVMITSEGGMDKMIEAIDEAGANDYVVKPFTATELEQKIRPFIELIQAQRKRTTKEPGSLFGRFFGK